MAKARYAIGIDLGTTNCSLAYVDLQAEQPHPELLPLPQWEGEALLSQSIKLPSFVWFMPKALVKQQARHLPWHSPSERIHIVLGREAKFRALKEPDRVAYAAKSWLSVGSPSTRQAAILPWGSAALVGEERLSPVAVQSQLLLHILQAWNARFAAGDDPQAFHEQHIVITVPASFDDLAQRLTLDAALQAGYPTSVELLEEPQAAFYDWYASHRSQDGASQQDGLILVCDIGGGTSDFTLLRVSGEAPKIERQRVSEHLLLGGDNIDLALAEFLKERMLKSSSATTLEELPRYAWQLLVAQARQLKEEVLSHATGDQAELFHVSIPLASSQELFGAHASASISRGEVQQHILEGFFPPVGPEAQPERPQSGLRNFGLPFVQDTAITRHLAAFLRRSRVDALLCAGGSLTPFFLQEHIRSVLQAWQPEAPIALLQHPTPDLAIAHGAAWYGWQRYHGSQLVESRYPRTLYLELAAEAEGQTHYLCLVPRGQARAQLARIAPEGLFLRVGQPVAFQLYSSLHDPVEASTPLPDWQALAPLSLEIPAAKNNDRSQAKSQLVPVALEAQIRETGVLELACRSLDDQTQSWRLNFAVESPGEAPTPPRQGASSNPTPPPLAASKLQQALDLLQRSFAKSPAPADLQPIELLPRRLEEVLGQAREEWSLELLRQLWEPLQDSMYRRQRSAEHESSWLYLAGFCLRPGWGASRDPSRIRLLWNLFDHGWNKAYADDRRLENQWWLMWRRVAGGLNAQQQARIMDKVLPSLRKDSKLAPEMIRLVAGLERVPMEKKIQAGRLFALQISSGQKELLEARIWALSRISSRYPLAAGPEAVVPPHLVEEWAELLKALPWPAKAYQRLGLFYQLAGRLRGEKALDIDPRFRLEFIQRLQQIGADSSVLETLQSVQERTAALDQQLFGESLPSGFVLRSR